MESPMMQFILKALHNTIHSQPRVYFGPITEKRKFSLDQVVHERLLCFANRPKAKSLKFFMRFTLEAHWIKMVKLKKGFSIFNFTRTNGFSTSILSLKFIQIILIESAIIGFNRKIDPFTSCLVGCNSYSIID